MNGSLNSKAETELAVAKNNSGHLTTLLKYNQTRPIHIILEGNIASGKSSLLRGIHHCQVENILEPNYNKLGDHRPLDGYHQDPQAWPTFQFWVLNQTMLQLCQSHPKPVILKERCPQSACEVFVKMAQKKFPKTWEFATIMESYGFIIQNSPMDAIIFVKTDAKVCRERAIKRGTVEASLPLEDFEEVELEYKNYIQNLMSADLTVIILNGNQDFEKVRSDLDMIMWGVDRLVIYQKVLKYLQALKSTGIDDVLTHEEIYSRGHNLFLTLFREF